METSQIINELKCLGLNPANPDLNKFDDERIMGLLKALELKQNDPEAASYVLAMSHAINQLDSVGYVKTES